MVKNIAPSLAPFGVTVNNVAPGAIATPRNAEIYEDDEKRAAVEAKIPCGRFGTPADIAPAVLLLCSDEGAYITGSEIIIDGGLSLK
jgi:glucose 1-dehydrogenase